jgi:hypothetical protein
MGYKIPGREVPGEVATKRLWSVWSALGVVLPEASVGAGLAVTPLSELDLETKKGTLRPKVREQQALTTHSGPQKGF